MVRDEVMFELWTLQLPLLRSPSLDDTPFTHPGPCVLIKLADLLMAVLISLRLSGGEDRLCWGGGDFKGVVCGRMGVM